VAGLDAQTFENDRQWAKACEGRLQQIRADECSEPQPIQAHEVSKEEAHQHHGARKSHHPTLDAHGNSPLSIQNYLKESMAHNISIC
jgi:hypothetical protein